MKFLLYSNPTNPSASALSGQIKQYLRESGHTVLQSAAEGSADMLLVFGGDGTLLRAVHEMQISCPVWCVNCGHLGYLTDCEPDAALALLPRLLAGDYRLEMRMMMQCALHTAAGTQALSALNEIVLHRGACQHALHLHLYINDQLAMRLHADGLIISTPTGSTAYNLSAGGPVLMPESRLLAVTPICAHAPAGAPMVVSAQNTVRVSWQPVYTPAEAELPCLVADGHQKITLHPGDSMVMRCGEQAIALIRTGNESFCHRLQGKLCMSRGEE